MSVARRWAGVVVLGGTLAVVLGALAGLAVKATTRGPASSAVRNKPGELHPKGDFTHPGAGFLMPERVGPWQRGEVRQFDAGGRDVAAGYNTVAKETDLPIVATLYVYPARPGVEIDPYFEGILEDVGAHHGYAKPEAREKVRLVGRFETRFAMFAYAEPWGGVPTDVPLHSVVVLYRWHSWWVKWRFTTPAPVDSERIEAIAELTESLLPPDGEERSEPATTRSGS